MRDLDGLFAFLNERAATPFAWGRRANDCVAFAIGAVEAQGLRARVGQVTWRTPAGAVRAVKRQGGIVTAMDARFARVPIALAKRGDVAAMPDDRFGARLMVVEGVTLVGPGEAGVVREARASALIAWDIESVAA